MDQPKGYQDDSGRVCKLKKSLYGLKQAHRSLHAKIDQFLVEPGFSSCTSERAIYRMTRKDLTFILIIYVDDLISVCDSMSQIEEFKARISQEFQMKDPGEIKHALGIKVDYQREKGVMYLSQEEFAEAILERFSMHESSPVATPIEKR